MAAHCGGVMEAGYTAVKRMILDLHCVIIEIEYTYNTYMFVIVQNWCRLFSFVLSFVLSYSLLGSFVFFVLCLFPPTSWMYISDMDMVYHENDCESVSVEQDLKSK